MTAVNLSEQQVINLEGFIRDLKNDHRDNFQLWATRNEWFARQVEHWYYDLYCRALRDLVTVRRLRRQFFRQPLRWTRSRARIGQKLISIMSRY